jgi:PPOX class probable F420-dependent enzyme
LTELAPEVRALFERGRNFVHLATVLPDGSPHSIPIWAILEGDRIAFFTQGTSRKARNLARDPRVALSVVDHENPYRNAQIRGRVVETLEGDEALEVIDRISDHYIGQPFPMRTGVVFLVEPERANFVDLPFRHEPAE